MSNGRFINWGSPSELGYGTNATNGTNGTEAVDMDTGVFISLKSPIGPIHFPFLERYPLRNARRTLYRDHDFPEMRAAFQVSKGIR